MKSLALLVFLFLAVPGSGQLAWDGIPFSTRIEFATLVLFLLVIFNRSSRAIIHRDFGRILHHYLTRPLLLTLVILKFFTFAAAPFGDGFESCYRSLYLPLEDPTACEKSYESPFLQANVSGSRNLSRIDSVVDFGENQFDWGLPFMNEFRVGNLWINRIPFQATYNAELPALTDPESLIPILAVGEITTSVNGKSVAQFNSYDRPVLTVVPLHTSSSELLVSYRYRDDEASIPPDVAPTPRGPYARLKIGDAQNSQELQENSRVLVLGQAKSPAARDALDEFRIWDQLGRQVPFKETLQPAADEEASQLHRVFDVEIEVGAISLTDAPLIIEARRGNERVPVGQIHTLNGQWFRPIFVANQSEDVSFDFTVNLTTDFVELRAWTPSARYGNNPMFKVYLLLIDTLTLLLAVVLVVIMVKTLRSSIVLSLLLAVAAWLAVTPLYRILPRFLGGEQELVVPYAILAFLVIPLQRYITSAPLPFILPTAGVLAYQKVADHLYFNHPGEGVDWWGKLLFYWRDSDWFAAQALARTIFVEESLRGGENVFWSWVGPRYLALPARILLGENDILIGLVSVTLGFSAIWIVAARFINSRNSSSTTTVGVALLFLGLIFFGDQLIVGFGFVVSSEYPTWIAMLFLTAFILRPDRQTPTWLLVAVCGVSAGLAQFRPNLLGVSVFLFAVVMVGISKINAEMFRRQITWGCLTYVTVISLSLIHNVFFGKSYVFFTGNASINYELNFIEILRAGGLPQLSAALWNQWRAIMYWHSPGDPNHAIFFWGAQLLFVVALTARISHGVITRRETLLLLLPLSYIVPMLKFQYSSYYPRHLVAASLLCGCAAILAWPKPLSKIAP